MKFKEPIITSVAREKSQDTRKDTKRQLDYHYQFKFVLIGDSKVGKSSLLYRYLHVAYADSYIPTIGVEFGVKILDVGEKKVKIVVHDTSGDERYRSFQITYLQNVNAIFVVFDLTNRTSFNNLEKWLDAAKKGQGEANIILVGTKSDEVNKYEIKKTEVEEFIRKNKSKYNINNYIETSSKTGENVQSVFETPTRLVLNHVQQSNSNESSAYSEDLQKQSLIVDLDRYIKRIESHKIEKTNKTDFYNGFWHHRESRAANREANYYLAKALLESLGGGESISEIFNDIKRLRDSIIYESRDSQVPIGQRPNYKERGINSDELNAIIKKARKYIASQQFSIQV
jgi:small GTP-binding protein